MFSYSQYRKASFYCALLHCALLLLLFFFFKLKVCDNPALNTSSGAISQQPLLTSCFLGHILVVLKILKKFFITVIFAMVICDQ